MEAHRHPNTFGTGWKHHTREFLMLFAAVTLGFFAENLREHYVDRIRERDYLAKIAQDLRTDISAMEKFTELEQARLGAGQRLLELYNSGEFRQATAEFYLQCRVFMLHSSFVHTNSGFIQMLHSGRMRLIRSQKINDSIQSYESAVERYRDTQTLNDMQMEDLRRCAADVFDTRVVNTMLIPDRKPLDLLTYYRRPPGNPALVTDDDKVINRMMQFVFTTQNLEGIRRSRLRELRESAIALIGMIEAAN
jgi:hypothetical protein